MISVEQIRTKAKHKFVPYLHSVLNEDTSFFPLHIPAAKGSATDDFALQKTEADNLYHYSKNKKDFGYTVVTNTIKTRTKGMQTVIEKILFETEAAHFKTNLACIKTQYLKFDAADIWYDWAVQYCSVLTEAIEALYWEQLFLCADWFLQNSPCGLYLREIPLPVHTKFIKQNRAFIFSLYCALKQSGTAVPISAAPIGAAHSPALKNTAEAIYAEWGVRTAPNDHTPTLYAVIKGIKADCKYGKIFDNFRALTQYESCRLVSPVSLYRVGRNLPARCGR